MLKAVDLFSRIIIALNPRKKIVDGRRWIGGCIYRAEKFCYATSLSVLLILTARPE